MLKIITIMDWNGSEFLDQMNTIRFMMAGTVDLFEAELPEQGTSVQTEHSVALNEHFLRVTLHPLGHLVHTVDHGGQSAVDRGG
jgi:hypothetical protein